MQRNLINSITTSSKILILFFIICTLLVAKSFFLIMFVTILVAIISILTDRNVKFYVVAFKKSILWLLFFSVIYIMFFRDILGFIIFVYKISLIIILLDEFISSVNFGSLADGFYTLIYFGRKIIPNLDKKVYNLTRYIYFYDFFVSSSDKIQKSQQLKNKRQLNVKYCLLPMIFYAVNKISMLEASFRLNFYKVKKENINLISSFLVIIFMVLFVTAVFKEVNL